MKGRRPAGPKASSRGRKAPGKSREKRRAPKGRQRACRDSLCEPGGRGMTCLRQAVAGDNGGRSRGAHRRPCGGPLGASGSVTVSESGGAQAAALLAVTASPKRAFAYSGRPSQTRPIAAFVLLKPAGSGYHGTIQGPTHGNVRGQTASLPQLRYDSRLGCRFWYDRRLGPEGCLACRLPRWHRPLVGNALRPRRIARPPKETK